MELFTSKLDILSDHAFSLLMFALIPGDWITIASLLVSASSPKNPRITDDRWCYPGNHIIWLRSLRPERLANTENWSVAEYVAELNPSRFWALQVGQQKWSWHLFPIKPFLWTGSSRLWGNTGGSFRWINTALYDDGKAKHKKSCCTNGEIDISKHLHSNMDQTPIPSFQSD